MLKERGIDRELVMQAIEKPARTEQRDDGTIHYLKPVTEHEGRILRVVAKLESEPPLVITVFFDRREKRGEL